MGLHICILGIDGSGKSTVAAALPHALAGEFGITAGGAGESFRMIAPGEDLLGPGFHPRSLPVAARFSAWAKRQAKRFVDNRSVYPLFKIAQMLAQDASARQLADRYAADVVVSDGNAVMSAMGRAANYRRPASEAGSARVAAPGCADLAAVLSFLFDGKELPAGSRPRLPDLRRARAIQRACRVVGADAVWLPDHVVFLDLSPTLAADRIAGRQQKIDRHENLADMEQARAMYLQALEALARYRGSDVGIHRIPVDRLPPGEVLAAVLERLQPAILRHRQQVAAQCRPLGTTAVTLAGASIWSKVFNARYLFRYLVPKWFRGAWREPLFAFSHPGRVFLREGYSAGVMKLIYDRTAGAEGFFERVFFEYPLHRAVFDRLQILTARLELEIQARLRERRELRIFTAPSGFACDLFRPLEAILARNAALARQVHVLAADLDPHEAIENELLRRAAKLGIRFSFVRGDLTDALVRSAFGRSGPFDLALFVGLSSWLPKPHTLAHVRWIRANLAPGGLFVTDCFTPASYALSGSYVGYKAHYYEPQVYRALLNLCGFDFDGASIESGRDGINHVVVVPAGAGTCFATRAPG